MLRIVTEFVDLVAMKRIEIQSFDLWPDCQGFNSRSECRIITAAAIRTIYCVKADIIQ